MPASLLVMVELPEIGDDMLAWSSFGTDALNKGVVGVGLAVLGTGVAGRNMVTSSPIRMARGRHEIKVLGFN